jgi:hypothetical protein
VIERKNGTWSGAKKFGEWRTIRCLHNSTPTECFVVGGAVDAGIGDVLETSQSPSRTEKRRLTLINLRRELAGLPRGEGLGNVWIGARFQGDRADDHAKALCNFAGTASCFSQGWKVLAKSGLVRGMDLWAQRIADEIQSIKRRRKAIESSEVFIAATGKLGGGAKVREEFPGEESEFAIS